MAIKLNKEDTDKDPSALSYLVSSRSTPNKFYKVFYYTQQQRFICNCTANDYDPKVFCNHKRRVQTKMARRLYSKWIMEKCK